MAAKPAHTGNNGDDRTGKPGRASFRVEVDGISDVGLVREGNEDSLLIAERHALYVVADGMGGHNCGEVASQFSIEAMLAFYDSPEITAKVKRAHRRSVAQLPKNQRDPSHHALRLRKAVESANISVFHLSQQHESLKDMGTTVVGVAFTGSRMYTANVGDSRIYRSRNGKMRQLSEDHSLVNEYVKMNMLRPEDVAAFPYKNVIVRAVGLHERVTVDMGYTQVRVGDQILLCSDGLTDLLDDPDINKVLLSAKNATVACTKLIEVAKSRGGHDNITCIVIRLHDGAGGDANREPAFMKLPKPAPPPTSPPPSEVPQVESEDESESN